jgi:dynein assembly factor 2
MSETSFEDKLKDLNLTNDELKRFTDAFKNEEFRKLFIEYADELNDPKNRELYENEIRAVEEQRGSDVTFIHPKPGHVLKTTINGKTKCFINIATNEHVDKPAYTKTDGTNGKQGVHWSLPHCLAGPHEDIDHDSNTCTVYDVIFSPDTYRMAETNAKFMKMIEDSALDSVENNYHCKLDRNNVKKIKMNFKGIPKATIIRKKKENYESEKEPDDIIEKAISTVQNHKVVLSSHNRHVNSPPPSTDTNPAQTNTPLTDENGFTIPIHRIVHRGEFDMQDCTISLVPQVRSMRPKELLVEVDLPLCASTNNVDLDVCERSLKLHCDAPKYSLDLHLPYPVRESDSHARFDKKQRKLLITLAVIKETPTIIEIDSNIDMDDVNEEPGEIILIPKIEEIVSTNEIPSNVTYTVIPFEYKQGLARVALVLHVKNVDKTSLKLENDGQHITIQLSSFGSGYYPLNHQLCLDFDEPMLFDTSENASTITFNDDNILILLKKISNNKALTQFSSGVDREDMKINYFTAENSTEKPNMTKEDFLVKKTDSSTSSNSDQQKKLSKKQAKKLAKENRKNQTITRNDNNEKLAKENRKNQITTTTTINDDNEKLAKKISKITLQSTPDEAKLDDPGKIHLEEKDDKLPEMPKVTPNPSIYRRHMSESQVNLEAVSNGEFKLKGILKNSTKYRSFSESFSDPFNGDFQHEEFIFERCSTTDDLTSSNENNSIVTSPDSGGSNSLCTTSGSSTNVKRVTFNNQISRKTFKPGGPVSGMKKLTSTQQRKLKKRKRQDSLNSQSSDQDDGQSEKPPEDYKNPVEFEDVLAWQATGQSQPENKESTTTTTKSAVRFTNPLIFELDN